MPSKRYHWRKSQSISKEADMIICSWTRWASNLPSILPTMLLQRCLDQLVEGISQCQVRCSICLLLRYGKACDIWSVGVICYVLLSGSPPFYTDNPRLAISPGMKRRIHSAEYTFPSAQWRHISQVKMVFALIRPFNHQ